jgi:hypothetical protein
MEHANLGMIKNIYGKWIDKEQPNYISEIAKELGHSYES